MYVYTMDAMIDFAGRIRIRDSGLMGANDGLCYVSNDEGAKILVVEMLESTAIARSITKGRPATCKRREAGTVWQ